MFRLGIQIVDLYFSNGANVYGNIIIMDYYVLRSNLPYIGFIKSGMQWCRHCLCIALYVVMMHIKILVIF